MRVNTHACVHTLTHSCVHECIILALRGRGRRIITVAVGHSIAVATGRVQEELTFLAVMHLQDKYARCECPPGMNVLFLSRGTGALSTFFLSE